MKALIDGDILRYEIGFAAETGWKAITGTDDLIPPFDYIEDLLQMRIASILAHTQANEYCLYLTEGKTFRDDIAITKPYKGQRIVHKPWHFDNLTAAMAGYHPNKVSRGIEADDAMAMESDGRSTIICSRDKDLRQVAGLCYSWELGNQPQFGPVLIDPIGEINLVRDKSGKATIKGTGYAFFCSQLLTGDRVDNIPGCDGIGPVAAYEYLAPQLEVKRSLEETAGRLIGTVDAIYNNETLLLEQGQLLWIVRRLNPDGTPELWRKDLYV